MNTAAPPQPEIDKLRQRVATAEFERDRWSVSGPEERYLEAYVIAKALKLELDEKLCQPEARAR